MRVVLERMANQTYKLVLTRWVWGLGQDRDEGSVGAHGQPDVQAGADAVGLGLGSGIGMRVVLERMANQTYKLVLTQ